MVVGGVICVLGAVVSQRMAPETTGLSLTRSSAPAAGGSERVPVLVP